MRKRPILEYSIRRQRWTWVELVAAVGAIVFLMLLATFSWIAWMLLHMIRE